MRPAFICSASRSIEANFRGSQKRVTQSKCACEGLDLRHGARGFFNANWVCFALQDEEDAGREKQLV